MSIVFIHIGENIPSCLFSVMQQARCFNPESDIYLLAAGKSYPYLEDRKRTFFERERIFLVDMDQIPKSFEHERLLQVHPMDLSVCRGLWLYATERFFVLCDFLKEKNIQNIVHLENDTMLYVDLKELLPSLQIATIAAPFQSEVSCIPCFVFIRDLESLHLLIEHMLAKMSSYQGKSPHRGVNDMKTLASFYKKWGSPKVMPLPTLMPQYRRFHYKRKSLAVEDNLTSLSFLSLNGDLFPGYIFDAAGLGIYLNGNDRRESPHSGPGTIHSRVLFDPRAFSFVWEYDHKGRKIPYLMFQQERYKIVNLHFHSKMVEEYTSF